MQEINNKEIREFFIKHKRKSDTNKYDYGHVLVIAGSLGMLGASVLVGRACMRSGAGLVTVAVPNSLMSSAMNCFVECMTLAVPTDTGFYFDTKSAEFLKKFLKDRNVDVVVLGPGLGRRIETQNFVKNILKFLIKMQIYTIVDADALFAMSNQKEQKELEEYEIFYLKQNIKLQKDDKKIIITPHIKEFQKLINFKNTNSIKKNREKYVEKIAEVNNIVCLLKGYETILSDGKNNYKNVIGNSGMATAGSGDVLSGIIAGIKSQFKDISLIQAAKIATYLHSLSGDIAKDNVGEISLIASDIIDFLPKAIFCITKF